MPKHPGPWEVFLHLVPRKQWAGSDSKTAKGRSEAPGKEREMERVGMMPETKGADRTRKVRRTFKRLPSPLSGP